MDFRPVLYVVGILLSFLSISMILPMLVDLQAGNPDWEVFLLCIAATIFFGVSLILSNAHHDLSINTRQAFMITVLSWIAMAAFGALPLYYSVLNLSFTDAFFESMSGITTTGATVISGLDNAPPGILLWRGIIQMFGGLGFIVMGMSLLPLLKVGGMRLFTMESSESEKALPRAAQLAGSISIVYFTLIALCLLCFMLTGMSLFDAAVHAMATLATGGFSNYDASFSHFTNPMTHVVAIIFMILGGMPFVLFIKAAKGDTKPLFRDSQVHWFIGILLFCSLSITGYLMLVEHRSFDIFLKALFNITSIATSTGFANDDYQQWGYYPACIFFFITFIGACSGSTSGGIKIFRIQVLTATVKIQIKKLLYPNGVFIPEYNGKPIPPDVPVSVMSFFFIYIVIFAVASLALCVCGLDILTSASAVVTSMSNVGPGLGPIVGPAGNFAPLPDAAKWILSLCMLLGRLEIYTMLVMISPHFWRT